MLTWCRRVNMLNQPSRCEFLDDFAREEPPEPDDDVVFRPNTPNLFRELEPQDNKNRYSTFANGYELNRGNDLPRRKYFWGQLYGCSSCFNLHDPEFIVSRKWILRTDFLAQYKNVKAVKISRHHFVVKVQNLKNGPCTVRITDLSARGTFVNGRLIGKNQTITLFDRDVVSIIHPRYHLFRFKDFSNAPCKRRT